MSQASTPAPLPPPGSGPKRTPVPAPLYRPLKAFAFDPSCGRGFGNYMTLQVPYEQLRPGPVGSYLAVIDYDGTNNCYYEPVDLNDPTVLIRNGLDPSESDPRFHQQMVYAVASETISRFEFALGRKIRWRRDSSRKSSSFHNLLRLFPHAMQEANAYYDPSLRGIVFGYFPASATDPGNNLPGQTIFTCLSHDIVAHEMTHALIDGIRSYFMEPTNPDTPAFHEAFADLVALFQHFSQTEALLEAIRGTRGMLQRFTLAPEAQAAAAGPSIMAEIPGSNPLVNLAQQFGEAMGMRKALRSALGTPPDSLELEKQFEPHARGAILVAAVFDAFFSVYLRRTRDLWRLAGVSRNSDSDLHPDLVSRLAGEVSKTARHFLNICIRALDYCPPVDLRFGDFLRALITSDTDLVADDDLGYRPAIIDGFRARGIHPEGVVSYSEESLLWCGPEAPGGAPVCEGLVTTFFAHATPEEIHTIHAANATTTHNFAAKHTDVFGLREDLPIEVASFHPLHRVGPDGQLNFGMVAEVIQTEHAKLALDTGEAAEVNLRGGAILIFNADGEVRYAIRKSLKRPDRIEQQQQYKYHLWERAAASPYQALKPGDIDFRAIHRGY
jgi:hypothetical protein